MVNLRPPTDSPSPSPPPPPLRPSAPPATHRDLPAVDLHDLPGGIIGTTLIIPADSRLTAAHIPALLEALDDDLLRAAGIDDGSNTFTVIRGSALGAFQPNAKPA